jgi:hypothetical protein
MTDNATSSPSVSARTYDHASVISKTLSAIDGKAGGLTKMERLESCTALRAKVPVPNLSVGTASLEF